MMNVVAICLVVRPKERRRDLEGGPPSRRRRVRPRRRRQHQGLHLAGTRPRPHQARPHLQPRCAKDVLERSKDKVKEAASLVTPEWKEDGGGHRYTGTKELICDTFGKCKHRIASGLDKAKEEVMEKVHKVEEDARQVKDAAEAKEVAQDRGAARRHVALQFDGRTVAGLVHLLGFATVYGTCARG